MSVPNFSSLARLEVPEKFVWVGGVCKVIFMVNPTVVLRLGWGFDNNCMSKCVVIMTVLQFQVEGQTKTSLKEKWFFFIWNNNLMMILVLVIVHNFAKFWFKESNLIQWNASYYKLSKIFTIGHLSTEACLNMRQWGGNQLDLERRRGVGRDWVRGDSSKNRRKFESGDLFSKNQSQQLNILGKLWSQ